MTGSGGFVPRRSQQTSFTPEPRTSFFNLLQYSPGLFGSPPPHHLPGDEQAYFPALMKELLERYKIFSVSLDLRTKDLKINAKIHGGARTFNFLGVCSNHYAISLEPD